jgi:alkylation response protein AidB-like acyl-CoA dehydrogenase
MDFQDTPEDAAFRAEARAFLEEYAPPRGSPGDFLTAYHNGQMAPAEYVKRCKAWQGVLAEHGWACITWPEAYGGRDGTGTQAAIFAEEHARFGVSMAVFAVGIGMAGPTIIAHGTPEQKKRFLPPLRRGEEVWCQLFSEPGAGSDLAGLSTRAERDGDEWIVNGQKVWTSGAADADLGILLARTDADQPKHRGITYFLVDMRQPGVEIRPLKQMTGASHFSEVFLTDVPVPADRVLGDVNAGWGVALTTLANERFFIGEGGTGPGVAELLSLARARGRTGDAAVRQGLAEAYIRAEILRYLALRVRTAAQRGETPGPEANVMKLCSAQQRKRLGELALTVQGPEGMLLGEDAAVGGVWQQQFLAAPSIRIAGGSDEIQRNIIGERVLGLPAEPRVDKGVPFRELVGASRGRAQLVEHGAEKP